MWQNYLVWYRRRLQKVCINVPFSTNNRVHLQKSLSVRRSKTILLDDGIVSSENQYVHFPFYKWSEGKRSYQVHSWSSHIPFRFTTRFQHLCVDGIQKEKDKNVFKTITILAQRAKCVDMSYRPPSTHIHKQKAMTKKKWYSWSTNTDDRKNTDLIKHVDFHSKPRDMHLMRQRWRGEFTQRLNADGCKK